MEVRRSTQEWEQVVGAQVRRLRIQAELTMAELAHTADISPGALRNLEHGRGATLRTLIRVTRALDRTEWLEALAPTAEVSPMAALRERQRRERQTRQRVRRTR